MNEFIKGGGSTRTEVEWKRLLIARRSTAACTLGHKREDISLKCSMDGILRGDLCPLLLAVTAGKHCLNLQAQQAFSTALTQRASQTGQTAASDQTTGHH